jgi:hypothetical protein
MSITRIAACLTLTSFAICGLTHHVSSNADDFPLALRLDPSQRLFVNGAELAGTLTFTYESDTLRINGRTVIPALPEPRPPCLPDSVLCKFHGHIVWFQECIARGGSVCDCSWEYGEKRDTMLSKIRLIYQEECAKVCDWWQPGFQESIEHGTAPDSILRGLDAAAKTALTALDPDVVGRLDDPLKSLEISRYGVLTYSIPGDIQAIMADLGHKEPDRPRESEPTMLEKSVALTRQLLGHFERDRPVVVFVFRGQIALSASGKPALRIFAEVDSVRANHSFATTTLPQVFVKRILDPM